MTAVAELPSVREPWITEPGIYELPDTEYHADPVVGGSLSSSGARTILHCPAKFDYERRHGGRPPKDEFDFGHAAHAALLGAGAEVVVLDYRNYKTQDAQKAKAAARAAGKIPALPHEMDVVTAMTEAVREHPFAGALFQDGLPEQSLFHRDQRTGVMMRARLDWLKNRHPGRRLLIPDYKTTRSAHPDDVQKAIADYGYHIQGAWYKRVVCGVLGLAADDVAFLLVMQEKTPPYVVTVVEPATTSLAWGDQLTDHALNVYQHCTDTGRWPGYSDDVETRELPRYIEQRYEIAEDRGDYDDPRGKL